MRKAIKNVELTGNRTPWPSAGYVRSADAKGLADLKRVD